MESGIMSIAGFVESTRDVWQPVLLVTDKPMLCECGKAAIILTLENDDYTAWCQACFEKEDEGE